MILSIHSSGKADLERGAPISITRARIPCFHRRLRPLTMRERCTRLACRRGSRAPVTTGSQQARGRRSHTLLLDTAAVGRTQQEERAWGRDQQAIFDGVILGLAALTLLLGSRIWGADKVPFRPVMGTRGDAGAMAGMATTGAGASVSGGTTVAASA